MSLLSPVSGYGAGPARSLRLSRPHFCWRKKRRDVVAPLRPLDISAAKRGSPALVHFGHTPLAALRLLAPPSLCERSVPF